MARRSEDRGSPIATKPSEVKRILRLANATRNDVFYDLGCGHGRVCIIAAEHVKRAVGIEDHVATYKEAKRAVKKAGLDRRVKIRDSDVTTARISDATIVYSTLDENYADIFRFERVLKKGCRFVSASVPLIGIKPEKRDGDFYLMKVPFKHAKDEADWAKAALQSKNGTPAKLYKKYRGWYGRRTVKEMRKIFQRRLKQWQG